VILMEADLGWLVMVAEWGSQVEHCPLCFSDDARISIEPTDKQSIEALPSMGWKQDLVGE